MTWEEFTLARQLEVELSIDTLARQAKRAEDEQAKRSRKNVSRGAR